MGFKQNANVTFTSRQIRGNFISQNNMAQFETNANLWINSKIGTSINMSGYTGTVLKANLIDINETQENGAAVIFVKNNETNITKKYYFLISYLNNEFNWFEIENYTTNQQTV